jgi:hypothetical protein
MKSHKMAAIQRDDGPTVGRGNVKYFRVGHRTTRVTAFPHGQHVVAKTPQRDDDRLG